MHGLRGLSSFKSFHFFFFCKEKNVYRNILFVLFYYCGRIYTYTLHKIYRFNCFNWCVIGISYIYNRNAL